MKKLSYLILLFAGFTLICLACEKSQTSEPSVLASIIEDGSLAKVSQPDSGKPWKTFGNDGLDPIKNFLGTTDPVDLVIKTSNTEHMRVTSSGNVGIGATEPVNKLVVQVGEDNRIVLNQTAPQNYGYRWATNGIRDWDAYVEFANKDLRFYSNTVGVVMALQKSNGNIGIGTISPQDKLEVSGGNIRVTGGSFIDDGTTLNAPDYVFEKDYPLMPLEELRAHIARQKHLPNVPSADDIRKKGLNLSQFQMRLLEKIEELTLYTLQQQEEIKILTAQVKMLKALLIFEK